MSYINFDFWNIFFYYLIEDLRRFLKDIMLLNLLMHILRFRRWGLIYFLCCTFKYNNASLTLISRLYRFREHRLPQSLFIIIIIKLRLPQLNWCILTWFTHYYIPLLGHCRVLSHSIRFVITYYNLIIIFSWCIEEVIILSSRISQ